MRRLLNRVFRRGPRLALVPSKPTVLGIAEDHALRLREHTDRALALSDPEELELQQGLRRGKSGVLWSASEAAAALGGARDARELLQVTKELLPIQEDPGAIGLMQPKTWRQLLEEHPPDNAELSDSAVDHQAAIDEPASEAGSSPHPG